MADRPTETRPMRDMLASIDRDIAAMPLPVRRQERTLDENQRVANLTGEVIRKAAEEASTVIMKLVEEVESRLGSLRKQAELDFTSTEDIVSALRNQAESITSQLKTRTDTFAKQNEDLIAKCHALETSINETVNHIIQIAQTPLNGGNSRGDPNETR